jgi:hypothetical protein
LVLAHAATNRKATGKSGFLRNNGKSFNRHANENKGQSERVVLLWCMIICSTRIQTIRENVTVQR